MVFLSFLLETVTAGPCKGGRDDSHKGIHYASQQIRAPRLNRGRRKCLRFRLRSKNTKFEKWNIGEGSRARRLNTRIRRRRGTKRRNRIRARKWRKNTRGLSLNGGKQGFKRRGVSANSKFEHTCPCAHARCIGGELAEACFDFVSLHLTIGLVSESQHIQTRFSGWRGFFD